MSVADVPPPPSMDAPTARLLRSLLWDEVAKYPPDVDDSELPTFGELRKRAERRLGQPCNKAWRKWVRATITVMFERTAAGLPLG